MSQLKPRVVTVDKVYTRQLLRARDHYLKISCSCGDPACYMLDDERRGGIRIVVGHDHDGREVVAHLDRKQIYAELAKREHVPNKKEGQASRRAAARSKGKKNR